MTTNNAINTPFPIDVADGGTNASSFTAYSVLCAGTTSTGTWQSVASLGTSGQILTSNGASSLPTFQTVTFGSGKISQIPTTTKTSAFSTSSATFTAVTGLSVSITPSSASNKVLVILNVNGINPSGQGFIEILRGATAICVGDASGSNVLATSGSSSNFGTNQTSASMTFLDSPATTSSTTYSVSATVGAGGGTFYINSPPAGSTSSAYATYASTITVLEVLP